MEEKFKDIPNYEGVYQASNLGRIKSLKFGKERILKQSINSNGYYVVRLCCNGGGRTIKVHQLIAMAFLDHIPNGQKIVVDHIDNNRLNNNLLNLQLISNRENCTKEHRGTSKYTGVHWCKTRRKWVSKIQINGKNKIIGRFDCEHKAGRAYKRSLMKITKNL